MTMKTNEQVDLIQVEKEKEMELVTTGKEIERNFDLKAESQLRSFVEKGFTCGHSALTNICMILGLDKPLGSLQIKTSDLYEGNQRFRSSFENVLNIAKATLTTIELGKEVKQEKDALSELENSVSVVTVVSKEFNRAYRVCRTQDTEEAIKLHSIIVQDTRTVKKEADEQLKIVREQYKLNLRKQCGLI